MVWWGRITPRFVRYGRSLSVRWRDPAGQVVQRDRQRIRSRTRLTSTLESEGPFAPGEWRVEALLDSLLSLRRSAREVEEVKARDSDRTGDVAERSSHGEPVDLVVGNDSAGARRAWLERDLLNELPARRNGEEGLTGGALDRLGLSRTRQENRDERDGEQNKENAGDS